MTWRFWHVLDGSPLLHGRIRGDGPRYAASYLRRSTLPGQRRWYTVLSTGRLEGRNDLRLRGGIDMHCPSSF